MVDKEVIVMVNNNKYLKTVFSLADRKRNVEKAYGIAGWVCFWLPIWVFGFEVLYYVCRLIANSAAVIMDAAGKIEMIDGRLNFIFDVLLAVIPLLYVILGYLAFGLRKLTFNYIFLAVDVCFFICCIVAIILGFQPTLYAFGIVYCMASFKIAIDCVKAYKDDKILQKNEGYPHFNATLMFEDEPKVSLLKYDDKKTYDELYDNRFAEYAEENPDTQMAQIYRKEKKEKDEDTIDEWFDAVLKDKNKYDEF